MKKVLSVLVACMMLSSVAFAAEDIRIYNIKLNENVKGEYKVVIPMIKGLEDDFQRRINNEIEEEMAGELKAFGREAKDKNDKLNISYDIKLNDAILSILIKVDKTVDGTKIKSEDKYINISKFDNKELKLEDLFKTSDFEKTLEKEINGEKIDENTKFYLDNKGNLNLVFNDYKKSKKDIKEVKISQDKLKDILKDEMIVGVVFSEGEIDTKLSGDVVVKIPIIKGLADKDFEKAINEKVRDDISKNIADLREKVEKLKKSDFEYKVNYKIREFNDIYSIELNIYEYLDEKDYSTEKLYYNIDTKNMKVLELEDLFRDQTYVSEINKIISKKIYENKSEYFNGDKLFKTIDKNQKFYIDNYGNVVVAFDEASIKDKNKGIPEFRISSFLLKDKFKEKYSDLGLRDPKKVIVNGKIDYFKDYINISDNGNMLIPIDDILDRFGYEKKYSNDGKLIDISRDGKKYSISLGENNYKINDADIIFEDSAKSINGYIYVPNTFIDRVLDGKSYIVDGVMNIELK